MERVESDEVTDALVTIVIPAFNAERTLDATLRSVRDQTHRTLEILVVDDGSTDGTADIALAHAEADPRVRLIRRPNGGVAAARNAGIQAARGLFVASVDADDLCAPEYTRRQLVALERAGPAAALAYTWSLLIDEQDRVIGSGSHSQQDGDVYEALCRCNFIGNGSATLARTAAIRVAGGYDPSLRARGFEGCEDLSLYLHLATKHAFAVVPEYLTGYRQTVASMSSKCWQMYRSFRLVEGEQIRLRPEAQGDLRLGRATMLAWLLRNALSRGDLAIAVRLAPRLALIAPGEATDILWQYALRRWRKVLGQPRTSRGIADPRIGQAFLSVCRSPHAGAEPIAAALPDTEEAAIVAVERVGTGIRQGAS